MGAVGGVRVRVRVRVSGCEGAGVSDIGGCGRVGVQGCVDSDWGMGGGGGGPGGM